MRLDISQAWTTAQRLVNGFVANLPRLILAVVLFSLFYGAGRIVRSLVRRAAQRGAGGNAHRTLELALGRLAQAAIVLVGLLIAVTAAFPSFTPANLVSTLGIGGVAIGFAFKNIFQNFLAGILLLVTRPFVVGDQIRFRAKQIILDVLNAAEGVAPDPKVDVIVVDLAESTVNLRARWWSDSRIGDVLVAQDRVLSEVKRRLTADGIDLPFPTRQILFHDQSEPTDGDRRRQREGWPAGEG